ncbi:MAG: hypothetical protein HQL66_15500 [Magnetococcales bacterium]|nr:hypothetical protein [Magnetococcales bacterium]
MSPRYPTSPNFRRHRPQGQLSPGVAGTIGILAVGGILYGLGSDGHAMKGLMEGILPTIAHRLNAERVGGQDVKFPVGGVTESESVGAGSVRGSVAAAVAAQAEVGIRDSRESGAGARRGGVTSGVTSPVQPAVGHGTAALAMSQVALPRDPAREPSSSGSEKLMTKGAKDGVQPPGDAKGEAREDGGESQEEKLVLTFYSDLKKQTVVLPSYPENGAASRASHQPAVGLGNVQSGNSPPQAVSYLQASRSTPWQQPLEAMARAGSQQPLAVQQQPAPSSRAAQVAAGRQGVVAQWLANGASAAREAKKAATWTAEDRQQQPPPQLPRVANVRPDQPGATTTASNARTPSATPIPVVANSAPRSALAQQEAQQVTDGAKGGSSSSLRRAQAARMDDGSFIVPLGDYPDFTRAARMTNRLQAKGVPAQVVRLSGGGAEPVFRVGIGPFPSEGDAMRAAQQWQTSL